uniref:Uncharacterized protein n=1 Tax=Biomphalaria glabrata TaxID=6526 RepID=A0A2C9JBX5_BIOGL
MSPVKNTTTTSLQPNMPSHLLHCELWRLSTFSKYPQSATKSAILLASNGFVYNGTGKDWDDSVTCPFCHLKKKNWQPEEDILKVHQQLSPRCPFLTHKRIVNIPFQRNGASSIHHLIEAAPPTAQLSAQSSAQSTAQPTAQPTAQSRGQPTAQSRGQSTAQSRGQPTAQSRGQSTAQSRGQSTAQSRGQPTAQSRGQPTAQSRGQSTAQSRGQPTAQSRGQSTERSTEQSTQKFSSGSVLQPVTRDTDSKISGERPKHIQYANLANRLSSFVKWPQEHYIHPIQLATAGFYFTGDEDCARCFYCGGGLRNWDVEDDVWEEHARWFPKCAFLLREKGHDFVNAIKEGQNTRRPGNVNESRLSTRVGVAAADVQALSTASAGARNATEGATACQESSDSCTAPGGRSQA